MPRTCYSARRDGNGGPTDTFSEAPAPCYILRMKNVLIAGGSGGIGQALCRRFLGEGWTVYSLDLKDNPIDDPRLRHCRCDLLSEQAIFEARSECSISELDVVVYCAGLLKMASLIEEPVDTTKRILAVNLLGMMHVVRCFSEDLIHSHGRFVLFSSEVGLSSAHPFNGPYSISKHAVEAYADSLRRELKCVGVKVVKIESGGVETPLLIHTADGFDELVARTTHYKRNLMKLRKFLCKSLLQGCSPDYLAAKVYTASVSSHTRLGYRIKNSPLIRLADIFGLRFGDWIFALLLKERDS